MDFFVTGFQNAFEPMRYVADYAMRYTERYRKTKFESSLVSVTLCVIFFDDRKCLVVLEQPSRLGKVSYTKYSEYLQRYSLVGWYWDRIGKFYWREIAPRVTFFERMKNS